jgi:hypothetical protein
MSKIQFGLAALCTSLMGCDVGASGGADPDTSRVVVKSAPQIRLTCAADSDGDAWLCPDELRVDCSATADVTFAVASPSGETCDAHVLVLSPSGPLSKGTHEVTVRNAQDEVLCTSELVVERSAPLQLVPKALNLWPPNHKLHEISVEDCVDIVGACPGEALTARFIWASSDEPVDANGDGHHEPDIALSADCQRLALRSERQGTSDGRIYSLGVRVVDGAGAALETTCSVSVVHDQSGRDAQPGPDAYRLDFDGIAGTPDCGSDEPNLQ